ncbi:uncharacterized protein PADG_06662 [Paracoccidioides brasiliensis Pb18]|uniref:Uncharacterized protein n=1 Tax=Paracoccidioides brasiliensis (strain Pb18) TaxID=502780 RepID=C1GHC6_PARBD|nr:uncharacterized protein PADG_06662 [Paracoccidioides brasiliensis Pb18]EEH50583.1 hypothetical protein PADG_06662 [Paracoccidioides brasiliensis Pb18]
MNFTNLPAYLEGKRAYSLPSDWLRPGLRWANQYTMRKNKGLHPESDRLDRELSTHTGLQQKAVSFRTLDHSSLVGLSLKYLLTRGKPETRELISAQQLFPGNVFNRTSKLSSSICLRAESPSGPCSYHRSDRLCKFLPEFNSSTIP